MIPSLLPLRMTALASVESRRPVQFLSEVCGVNCSKLTVRECSAPLLSMRY